jgi:hypothetical protein
MKPILDQIAEQNKKTDEAWMQELFDKMEDNDLAKELLLKFQERPSLIPGLRKMVNDTALRLAAEKSQVMN